MKKFLSVFIVAALLLLTGLSASAAVKLPNILADNMVLQQQSDVKLWGESTPGRAISVTTSWNKKAYSGKADSKGKWCIQVQTPEAGGPYSITISDGTPVTLKNILIGEVWFCSGQSNMEMPVKGFDGQPVEGVHDMLIMANKKTPIRSFIVKKTSSKVLETKCDGGWVENTPEGVASTTAVGYFFAKYLQEVLDVPVGIIFSAWGGTKIEPWMTTESLQKFPEIDLSHLKSDKPLESVQLGSVLFNSMVAPYLNYKIKGAIWYQGESNREAHQLYERLMPAFVKGWRDAWGIGEFPFYYVQIAPYWYDGPEKISSAQLREAQFNCMKTIPNSGMAVTMDIATLKCIHPSKKKEVGTRLAYWALAKTYNKNVFSYSGPIYKSVEIKEGKAYVSFDNVPCGIGPLGTDFDNFEIAGADKVFHPAKANIEGGAKRMIVSSPDVPEPVAVRYGYKNCVNGNLLFDVFGLPASSFRTDNW